VSLHPVFIVGSPRSGTSILVSALLRAGYGGFFEGNFLSLVRVVERDVDRHFTSFYSPNPKVLTSAIDKLALKHQLSQAIVDAAIRQQPAGPWLDKTGGPEMIEAIPFLRAVFPTARFVFAKRRALENVVSRLIKFPNMSFDYHCADWARTMAAWRMLRGGALGADMIEIDQRDISAQPELVARQLGTFLQLGGTQVQSILKAFTSQRPQETEAGSAHRVLSMAKTGWSETQKASFHRLCGVEMQEEGYTIDEFYRGWR
jgi:hypothetical protein